MPPKTDCVEATVTIPVRDLPTAREWYGRLLGKAPDLEPVPGVVEFRVGDTWLQLQEGSPGTQGWDFRFGVRDLEHERRRLDELGIVVGETVTVPAVIRFFDFRDPDGNPLSL